jgi:hypothetical protein
MGIILANMGRLAETLAHEKERPEFYFDSNTKMFFHPIRRIYDKF